jgi:peptide/nickel transport system substrate-binding protein
VDGVHDYAMKESIMRRGLLLVLLMLIFVLPVQAGRGTLRMAIGGDINNFNFSPLNCGLDDCVSDLLFPRLLYIAPDTQTIAAPPDDSFALTASWEMSDDRVTLHLRDDLTWTDGTPITAYDVFFSYLAYSQNSLQSQTLARQVAAAVPLDATTIQFIYRDMTCDALNVLNINVLPAHAFQTDFEQSVSDIFADGYSEEAWAAWNEFQFYHYNFYSLSSHPFFNEPTITAGSFRFHSRQYGAYVRLVSNDEMQGLELISVPDGSSSADMLMRGEIDLTNDFNYTRVRDLRANDDVRVFQSPTSVWIGVSFNFADPRDPLPAFDEDGNPLEQGQHRIFNDVIVRRALQTATNVPALIEAFAEGLGTVMPANLPAGTWAFDDTLSPVGYDPMAAARMLEDAGWRDFNRDGVRECTACTTAPLFTALSFELRIPYGFSYDLANILAQQWAEIGAYAYVYEGDASDQTYDAALVADWLGYPASVDQYLRFTPAGDGGYGVDGGSISISSSSGGSQNNNNFGANSLNTGSYNNPDVTALLEEARTLSSCSTEARAELYHEAQRLLQEDQPYVWLFSVDSVVAARTSVANIAPYPNATFWNIHDWVIGG